MRKKLYELSINNIAILSDSRLFIDIIFHSYWNTINDIGIAVLSSYIKHSFILEVPSKIVKYDFSYDDILLTKKLIKEQLTQTEGMFIKKLSNSYNKKVFYMTDNPRRFFNLLQSLPCLINKIYGKEFMECGWSAFLKDINERKHIILNQNQKG